MKKILLFIIILAMFISLPVYAKAQDEKTKAEIVSEFKNNIQIGTWIPYILTDEGAATMKENGLDFIFIWWYDNYEKAIDLCEKYDIKCILDANIRYTSSEKDIRSNMQKEYWDSPVVIGYSISDEPSADKFDFLANAVRIAKEEQPDLIPYINLFPQYASPEQLGTPDYEEYIRLFTEKINVDYISTDVYPYYTAATTEKTYLTSIDIVNNQCIQKDKDHWLHIQSLGFGANRSPSAEDMISQMYIGLSFGVTKFMHFCYAIPHPGLYEATEFYGASVTYEGEKTEVWDYTKAMNDELKLISDTVKKYSNLGTFIIEPDFGKTPGYILEYEQTRKQFTGFDELFKTFNSYRASIVGCFESKDENKNKAFTIVNAAEINNNQTSQATFSFNSPHKVTAYPDGTKKELLPDENGMFTIDLGIGDGLFIEIKPCNIIKGDLNSDGKTSITDAILLFRAAAGKINLDYYEKYAADIDGNDIADITDAMLLIMNIAGRN